MTTTTKERLLFFDSRMLIIFSITLIAVMGVASIAPSLPLMINHFGISANRIGLVITIFTLPGVLLTLPLGVIADRVGRKQVIIPSLILFALAGFGCFFAPSYEILLVLRFIQGAGAAALGALNITLIGDLLPPEKRAAALGYNAAVLSVGTAAYPFVGGALAVSGWNFPFILPLAALLSAVAVGIKLKNPERNVGQDFGEYVAGALKSVRNIKVIAIFVAAVITFIILYGSALTYFPILMHEKFGANPFAIGLLISTMSISTGLISLKIGALVRRFGSKNLMVFGFVCYAVALLALPLMPAPYAMLLPTIIYGVGNALTITCAQTMLVELAPIKYRAAFMATYGTLLRVGQTLGPIIMGFIYVQGGISFPFWIGAGFAVTAALLIIIAVRGATESAEQVPS